MENERKLKIMTGKFGAFQFGTELVIYEAERLKSMNHLAKAYRATRDKYYYKSERLLKYENNKLIKFLKRIKLINI